MGRTIAIGDVHGDIEALRKLLGRIGPLASGDRLVFLGDYLDRGPCSREVVELLRTLPTHTKAEVITLRGNHEDAWLRVVDRGWPEFLLPRSNGCLETLRSFRGEPPPDPEEPLRDSEVEPMFKGAFFPADVVEWMRGLPFFFEDEHAIYVHAGLVRGEGGFRHPSAIEPPIKMLWCRDRDFFENYQGKLVVFGHTVTSNLPPELSSYTPEDPDDLWAGPCAVGVDTGAGSGGFLSAIELPARVVYESRDV